MSGPHEVAKTLGSLLVAAMVFAVALRLLLAILP